MRLREVKETEDGLCHRLKYDSDYRDKMLQLLRILCVFGMVGWTEALNGPTFPDLRTIINEDLDTSSWLFTVTSVGFFLGSIATGFLYRLKNRNLLFAFVLLILAIAVGVVPWCPYFYLMLFVKFVVGFLVAIVSTGVNADVVSMWTENTGFYMQVLHSSFSLGGMISPLVAQPFLAPDICASTDEMANHGIHAIGMANVSQTVNGYYATLYKSNHGTENSTDHRIYSANATYYSLDTGLNECNRMSGETNVMYVYLLTAVILVLNSVSYLIASFTVKARTRQNQSSEKRLSTTGFQTLPIYLKVSLLGLISMLLFLYCGTEITFFGFLSTFTVLELNWSEKKGALATSVNWICFGIGRFAGIFISRVLRTSTILYIFPTLLIISQMCLLISSSLQNDPLFIISVGMIGAARSVVVPSVFTWTAETVTPVAGGISALFLATSSLGVIVFPLLFGYTMELFSPKWFLYIQIGESILWIVVLGVTVILSRRSLKPLTLEIEVKEKIPFTSS